MKNFNGKGNAILVGAVSGAVLMALVFMMVFGLHTGIAGAVLVLLIVAVSGLSGWILGLSQLIGRWNRTSYLKGYRKGKAEKTLIVNHPMYRCTFTVPDET